MNEQQKNSDVERYCSGARRFHDGGFNGVEQPWPALAGDAEADLRDGAPDGIHSECGGAVAGYPQQLICRSAPAVPAEQLFQ